MKVKQYIFPLLVLIAFLGIAHHQQEAAPNQEIVLQFQNVEVNTNDVQTAITLVEKELHNIGVTTFQVKEEENGTLKISYYSNADVTEVKRLLSKRIIVDLSTSGDEDEPSGFPFEDDTVAYNIDVFEINSGIHPHSGFDGVIVQDYRTKADRLSKPKPLANLLEIILVEEVTHILSLKKQSTTSEFAIQQTLNKIPEVRAGPLS